MRNKLANRNRAEAGPVIGLRDGGDCCGRCGNAVFACRLDGHRPGREMSDAPCNEGSPLGKI